MVKLDAKAWHNLSFADRLKVLEERFRRVDYVASLNDSGHSESEALALGLLDIQKAVREIDQALNDLLTDEKDDESLRDLLIDIGDAYRDIWWHMKEMRFFSYIFAEPPDRTRSEARE